MLVYVHICYFWPKSGIIPWELFLAQVGKIHPKSIQNWPKSGKSIQNRCSRAPKPWPNLENAGLKGNKLMIVLYSPVINLFPLTFFLVFDRDGLPWLRPFSAPNGLRGFPDLGHFQHQIITTRAFKIDDMYSTTGPYWKSIAKINKKSIKLMVVLGLA